LLTFIPASVTINYEKMAKSICILGPTNFKNLDDRTSKKKNEEAVLDAVCELLKLTSVNSEEVQEYNRLFQDYIHKVCHVEIQIYLN